MRRRILGFLTVSLLLVAGGIRLWFPDAEGTLACCWRGGALLGAAWLAFEDVQRLPNWLLISLPIALVVIVRWPRMLWMLLPLVVAAAFLRRFLFAGKAD